jgi:eukaryotic-like serine/threonine-protein kinase
MNNLAEAYRNAGQFANATALHEETLAKQKVKLGPDHATTLTSMNNLALTYEAASQLSKALPLYEDALTKRKAKFGADNPDTLSTMEHLGRAYLANKQPEKSVLMLRDCLAIREKKLPGQWPTATAKSLLGDALLGQKKYAEAEPLLLAGYEGLKANAQHIPPQGKNNLPDAVARLVKLYDAWGKPDEAAKWKKVLEGARAEKKP